MNNLNLDFSNLRTSKILGRVISSSGVNIIAELPMTSIGDIVNIELPNSNIRAEVLGFSDNRVVLAPYSEIKGLIPGARVSSNSIREELILSSNLIGSLTDAYGNIIVPSVHTNPSFKLKGNHQLEIAKIDLIHRLPIREPLWSGVRSIDTFTTMGKGQKLLLLAEPGVGKSTLLNSFCQNVQADLIIVALIGERGREVVEFYEQLRESGGDSKTIVVSSTSDSSPLLKRRAAITAIRMAEVARDEGLNVFLAFDSLTRYIRAIRDIGLSAGQQPVRRGYPASVFEEIPKYIERAGNFTSGSITAIYTMLSSGDVEEDPLVEEVKGLTDGHLLLSRKLAEQGIYPALDITKSLSRISSRFFTSEELHIIQKIKSIYSILIEERELVTLGGMAEQMYEISNKLKKIEDYLKIIDTAGSVSGLQLEELKHLLKEIC